MRRLLAVLCSFLARAWVEHLVSDQLLFAFFFHTTSSHKKIRHNVAEVVHGGALAARVMRSCYLCGSQTCTKRYRTRRHTMLSHSQGKIVIQTNLLIT